jgi:hypothetical protein
MLSALKDYEEWMSASLFVGGEWVVVSSILLEG